MADVWKVIVSSSLMIREKPTSSSKKLGALYNGNQVNVDQYQGNWVHFTYNGVTGWSCTISGGKSYMVRVEITQDTPAPPADNSTEESVTIQKENLKEYEEEDLSSTGYLPDWVGRNLDSVSTTEAYLNSIEDSLGVDNCRGIHGMPYQFMPIADTRVSGAPDAFGRKFSEKIVARLPILCVTPGTPVFLDSYNSNAKKNILDAFIKKGAGGDLGDVDSLFTGDGKFYSIKFDYRGYYNYVNELCRNVAFFMGIEDEEVNGMRLRSFDWGNGSVQADLSNIINYTDCVAFYIDSDKSVSETFGNDTTDSTLKGTMNNLSDMGRELQYYLGSVSGATGMAFDQFTSQENLTKNMDNMNEFIEGIMGKNNGNIFKRLTGSIQTVASGGRLIFPEIWSDSSFSRSYSIQQTLVSPDTDDLSIYLNILVPMIHWIALVAPRSAMAQSYIAPYICRASYKGQYNIDMGIFTDLGFAKGDEGSWTRSGLPTVVKVSATLKDLYSAFSISNNSQSKMNAFNNTILMDYLANMCGININEIDIARNIEMYLMSKGNAIGDKIRFDIFRGLEQNWTNKVNSIYRNAFF